MRVLPAALSLLLAWSLCAFGAVYDWAFAPALAASIAGGLLVVWRAPGRPAAIERWLGLAVVMAGLQLAPLPTALRAIVSPEQQAYWMRQSLAPPDPTAWHPLHLYPASWLMGIGVLIAGVAVFVWARHGLDARGARQVARHIAWLGLAVSAFALMQPALFPNGLIYGFWLPEARAAHPIGPVVSRNHFAAWIVLAWPVTLGYLLTHGRTHWRQRRVSTTAAMLGDSRAMWLLLAAALMVAALLITQSRAGTGGFVVAVLVLLGLAWRRLSGVGRAGVLALLVVVAAAVSLWATPAGLLNRLERAYSGADGGRPGIWAQSAVLARAFPAAGIGLGAFELVMPAYQTASFEVLINHAHNQYLHLFVEGGVLVAVPLGAAGILLLSGVWRRVRADPSPMVHLRQGAVAGLAGLAVLSVFETPLLTPAVALLAAATAGLAMRGTDPAAPYPDEAG